MTAVGESDLYHPWTTYIAACEEARQRGDRRVGTEHLLLGLLRDPQIEEVLGVTHEQARLALTRLDNEALASINVPEELNLPPLAERALLPRPNFLNVLKGRMKMTPSAKGTLTKYRALMLHHQTTSPGQLLAWLLELRAPDPVAQLFDKLKVDTVALRARLENEFAD
jgi:hypothetical protein